MLGFLYKTILRPRLHETGMKSIKLVVGLHARRAIKLVVVVFNIKDAYRVEQIRVNEVFRKVMIL